MTSPTLYGLSALQVLIAAITLGISAFRISPLVRTATTGKRSKLVRIVLDNARLGSVSSVRANSIPFLHLAPVTVISPSFSFISNKQLLGQTMHTISFILFPPVLQIACLVPLRQVSGLPISPF